MENQKHLLILTDEEYGDPTVEEVYKYEGDLKPFWKLPIFDWSKDSEGMMKEKSKYILTKIINKIVEKSANSKEE